MKVLYPNNGPSKIERIFLAGTIDNGASENWQEKVIEELKDFDITIYNPRRLDWDSSWKQDISNDPFNQQVNWELDHLERSDLIIMYFLPGSQSPISLLELGIFYKKMVVCCPDGFWRKGNVDIVCQRYNIPQYNSINDLLVWLKNKI
jgi:hypothetical protein